MEITEVGPPHFAHRILHFDNQTLCAQICAACERDARAVCVMVTSRHPVG